MSDPTQCERLLAYLRTATEVTSLGIVQDLHILNTTGRISDLRAMGHEIIGTRDSKTGVWYYRLREPQPVVEDIVPGQIGLFE